MLETSLILRPVYAKVNTLLSIFGTSLFSYVILLLCKSYSIYVFPSIFSASITCAYYAGNSLQSLHMLCRIQDPKDNNLLAYLPINPKSDKHLSSSTDNHLSIFSETSLRSSIFEYILQSIGKSIESLHIEESSPDHMFPLLNKHTSFIR
jgi:hypothetical protein